MLIALAACSQERIAVHTGADVEDYKHTQLREAVDKFVAAGRTADAYAELAQTVLALRPSMDRSVGQQAELKLVTLALAPVNAAASKPLAEQVDILALTVWPTLLAPPIEADKVLQTPDPKAAELMPKDGESAYAYMRRLCGGVLAADCKQVVPEYQGAVISTLAIRRATERARNAVSDCIGCENDPGWKENVRGWESLDRLANGTIHDVERRAAPDNWPIAGNASQDSSQLDDATALWREAEINTTGEVVIGGQRYSGEARIDALRELRGDAETITLHLRPEISLAQVKGILVDAKKSGAKKVAVVARTPHYPWERRIYWLSIAGTTRAGLRPSDSLQLLLHTVDHIASPGAVARVD